MSSNPLSVDQLKRAVTLAEQIQKLESELAALLGGSSASASSPSRAVTAAVKAVKKRRTMSPEARAKITAAQKARWAKIRGEQGSAIPAASAAPAAKKKAGRRKISPEGRAAISAAAKKRWADKKAAKA